MSGRWAMFLTVIGIALWAIAPMSWIQMIRDDISRSIFPVANASQAESPGIDAPVPTVVLTNGEGGDALPCDSLASPTPFPPPVGCAAFAPTPALGVPASTANGLAATFQLCGTSDPQVQRSIENLIAGRGFSARLVSRSDGCADLTITVSANPASGFSSGRQSTNLSVSSGSGGTVRTISVQISSENGTTHVAIGPGN